MPYNLMNNDDGDGVKPRNNKIIFCESENLGKSSISIPPWMDNINLLQCRGRTVFFAFIQYALLAMLCNHKNNNQWLV